MRSHVTQIRTLAASLVLAAALACAHGGMSVGLTYTERQPPPDRVEVIGVAPGAGYVWVGGYWNWNSGRYAWRPGYWARPPRGRSAWVAPSWEHRSGRYQFRRGYWR